MPNINDLTGDAPVITLDEIKGRFSKRTQRHKKKGAICLSRITS